MGAYIITGGRSLSGTVPISGAKNAVLPMLAACVACPGEYRLHNCPALSDVDSTLEILEHLGCSARRSGAELEVDTRGLCRCDIPRPLMQRLRSSVIFLGALLARCGEASVWMPGGCSLGLRPIDLHLAALERLGAVCDSCGGEIRCRAARLQGETVTLRFPSVGATENTMLAALGCASPVTICNAAQEPEIAALGLLLARMGAQVHGAGTSVVQVCGGGSMHGAELAVPGDRIEAATFLAAVCSCGGSARLTGVNPAQLTGVLDALAQMGVRLEPEVNGLRIAAALPLRAPGAIRTAPYPGFPTDAQALAMAAVLKARGTTVIEETIFENRFRHVPALQAMGADIQVAGRVAVVRGVPALRGAQAEATDLRGGAAMVVAALGAQGESRIADSGHIRRGYGQLSQKLGALGAEIRWHEYDTPG